MLERRGRRKNVRSRGKKQKEAERNRKKNKMKRRNMDDALCGEMVDETQDVALNLADFVGGGGQSELENRT